MRFRHVAVSLTVLGVIAALPACGWFDSTCEGSVSIVGDSLLFSAQVTGQLETKLRGAGCEVVHFDAVPGRTTAQGAPIVEAWAAAGELPGLLVVGLGTNDCDPTAFRAAADRIVAAARGRSRILWVDTQRVDCDEGINGQIDELARTSDDPPIEVYGFRSWMLRHDEFSAGDGIHLNDTGYRRYATRLTDEVARIDGLTAG